MKAYILSLAAGFLIGVIYGLLKVRSPAPPVIALIGLAGILAGEQVPSLVKHLLGRHSTAAQQTTQLRRQVRPHVFGEPPQRTRTRSDGVTTEAKS
ncbi:XapX domain-containing protein [Dyella humicola]|uniref:XapX domain-containing protein n=1 Tax=Dyella humicola TaxID=2992126 RepID=UPI00225271A0|nr:XapX domain-containing protein [Dyella humicola]